MGMSGGDRMSGTSGYEPVIGLEIHVQLKTRTKMFCGCELSFGDPPNIHMLPGVPGAARARCPWSTPARSTSR